MNTTHYFPNDFFILKDVLKIPTVLKIENSQFTKYLILFSINFKNVNGFAVERTQLFLKEFNSYVKDKILLM